MITEAIPTESIIEQIGNPHEVWVITNQMGEPIVLPEPGYGMVLSASSTEFHGKSRSTRRFTSTKYEFDQAMNLARRLKVNHLGVMMLGKGHVDYFPT